DTGATLDVVFTVSGTASAGSDYEALNSPASFGVGESQIAVTVAVNDDVEIESPETVIVIIQPDASYSIGSPASDTVTIADDDGFGSLDIRVASSSDDVEERASGSMRLTSSDLELGIDKGTAQLIGLRFPGVGIPQGATITNASIQFQVDETSTTPTELAIRAEDANTATPFVSTSGNVSSRAVTDAVASWSPPAWNSVGQAGPDQQTPDLSAVVQEVVDRPGWSSGNALVFIIDGTGTRVAEAYNGVPAAAPLLHVEYSTGPVPNRPPVATDDTASALEETLTTIDVVSNDFDPDGNLDVTSVNTDCVGCALPTLGTLVNNGDGTFDYTSFSGTASSVDTFVYELCDDEGACDTAQVDITILSTNNPTVFETRVGSGSDDAEERPSGSMYLSSSDLELIQDKTNEQTVGLRFTNIQVPQGATITNAWVQFQTDETDTVLTQLTIRAQNADDTTTFVNSSGNISNRAVTSASVPWSPPAWNSVGEAGPNQRTPNLSGPIQEVINRTGWAGGNSIVVIITGSGTRTAEAYNGVPAAAPLLHIEYTP
ncbi:MAG: hypothetical protein OEW83_17755, partial [Acidimicrobiia bacterium]|nr:hypothetical protein [Acidimicrobiia bacterium]